MTRRILNYGNYGIFLIMGNAGFGPSAVVNGIRGPIGLYRVVIESSKWAYRVFDRGLMGCSRCCGSVTGVPKALLRLKHC